MIDLDEPDLEGPITNEIQETLHRISRRKKQIDKKIDLLLVEDAKLYERPTKKLTAKELAQEFKNLIPIDHVDLSLPKCRTLRICLKETETLSILDVPSQCVIADSEEAKRAELYNQRFKEYKERKESIVQDNASAQTLNACLYKQSVQTKRIKMKDVKVSATEWDMFDSFLKMEKARENQEDEGLYSESFIQSAQLCSRVLASNVFHNQQMTFITKHQPSRTIRYTLDILWELKEKESGAVTSICVNPQNKKLVAIGYGDRDCKGLVVCWNSKNPQNPERKIETSSPVSCLDFSKRRPYLIGFTTESGEVSLLNIEKNKSVVTPLFKEESEIVPDPEWSCVWIDYQDLEKKSDRLMTVGHNGLVRLWDPEQKEHKELLTLTYAKTPIGYQQQCKGQHKPEIFHLDHYICYSIELDPSDIQTYYVSTNEGSILTCKMSKILGEKEVKASHRGAVLGMKHNVFSHLVYLSYGCDFKTKIWIKGIEDPVLIIETLNISPILCAMWSPSHSSCLVTLSREELCFWDISRNILDPMVLTTRSKEPYFSTAAFTIGGTVNHLLVTFRKILSDKKALLNEIELILGPTKEE